MNVENPQRSSVRIMWTGACFVDRSSSIGDERQTQPNLWGAEWRSSLL